MIPTDLEMHFKKEKLKMMTDIACAIIAKDGIGSSSDTQRTIARQSSEMADALWDELIGCDYREEQIIDEQQIDIENI